jgi:hypothetical protein
VDRSIVDKIVHQVAERLFPPLGGNVPAKDAPPLPATLFLGY